MTPILFVNLVTLFGALYTQPGAASAARYGKGHGYNYDYGYGNGYTAASGTAPDAVSTTMSSYDPPSPSVIHPYYDSAPYPTAANSSGASNPSSVDSDPATAVMYGAHGHDPVYTLDPIYTPGVIYNPEAVSTSVVCTSVDGEYASVVSCSTFTVTLGAASTAAPEASSCKGAGCYSDSPLSDSTSTSTSTSTLTKTLTISVINYSETLNSWPDSTPNQGPHSDPGSELYDGYESSDPDQTIHVTITTTLTSACNLHASTFFGTQTETKTETVTAGVISTTSCVYGDSCNSSSNASTDPSNRPHHPHHPYIPIAPPYTSANYASASLYDNDAKSRTVSWTTYTLSRGYAFPSSHVAPVSHFTAPAYAFAPHYALGLAYAAAPVSTSDLSPGSALPYVSAPASDTADSAITTATSSPAYAKASAEPQSQFMQYQGSAARVGHGMGMWMPVLAGLWLVFGSCVS